MPTLSPLALLLLFAAVSACSSPAQRGRVVVTDTKIERLPDIDFEPGSVVLLEGATVTMDAIAATLIGNPDILALEIQSHSADCGPSALELTRRRAAAVTAHIEKHNVPARLTSAGYGCTQPITMNPSEAEQAKNNRVEFQILERKREE